MASQKFMVFAIFALVLVICSVQSADLILGNNTVGNVLLHRTNATRNAVTGVVQTQDVVYRGFAVNITYIAAREVGASQNATARLVSGGLGAANCTLRFTSQISRGYNYTVEIWGK